MHQSSGTSAGNNNWFHSLISLQVLSGKQPWSEVQRDSNVVVYISQGRRPSRPESRAIDDRHWDFIQQCWLSIQERPSAKEIITSTQQFLSCYPQFPPLRHLFTSSTTQPDSLVDSNDPSLPPDPFPIDGLDRNVTRDQSR